jgi:hemolysin activation/secretion protein
MRRRPAAAFVAWALWAGVAQAQGAPGLAVQDQLRATEAQDAARAAAAAARPGLRIDVPTGAPPVADPACVPVRSVDVEGITRLSAEAVNAALSPFASGCLGVAAIDGMLQALTALYLDQGLITSRAYVPPQDLSDGRLRLVVVEGYVEAFVYGETLNGRPVDQPRALRLTRAFPLEVGDILDLRALEQGIDNLSAPPSARATLDIQPGSEVGASVLAVTVQDDDRLRGAVGYRLNRRLEREGEPVQNLSLSLAADNVLARNETWRLALSGGAESNALSLGVSVPQGWWRLGAEVGYTEQWTQLTATTELLEQTGTLSVTGSRLLSRGAEHKARIEIGLDYSAGKRAINGTPLSPIGHGALSIGYRHERIGADRFRSLGVQVMAGRHRDGAVFRRVQADHQFFRRLPGGITWFAATEAQLGSETLPGALAFGIGGAGVVRGFEGAAVSGPTGLRTSHEITLPRRAAEKAPVGVLATAWRAAEPYGFADFGVVRDAAGHSTRMASVGAGVRLGQDGLTLDIALALPVRALTRGAPAAPGLRILLTRKLF